MIILSFNVFLPFFHIQNKYLHRQKNNNHIQQHTHARKHTFAAQNSRARFTMIFQLGKEDKLASVTRPTINDLNASSLAEIAQSVASTGQLVNIVDINSWIAEHPDITVDDELKQAQVILSMPIINGQKNVIGVVQLINKVGCGLYVYSDEGDGLLSLLCTL